MGQESYRSGLAGWFWLGVSHDLGLGLWSSKDLTGTVGSTSKEVHLCGWQAVAGCWLGPQFLSMWASPQRCLSVLTMWQPVSHRKGDSRDQGGSRNVFWDPALEVTFCHFHSILLVTQSSPDWMWQETIQGTSLVVQWLRLCAPNAGGPGSIPGQGTRSCTWQRRSRVLQLRSGAAK